MMLDLFNERDKKQEKLSGSVKDVGFDPSDFGFELYIPKRFAGFRGHSDKDYLIYNPGTEKTARTLNISLCEDTADFIVELIGEKIGVYVNDKGQLLICQGNTNNLYRNGKSSGRRKTTITGLADKLFAVHGEFQYLYLTCKPYAKGNAVILTPNGERR